MKKYLFAIITVIMCLCLWGIIGQNSGQAKVITWNKDKVITVKANNSSYLAYLSKDGKKAWIFKVKVGKNQGKKMVFPKKIEGKPVTRIGDYGEYDPAWDVTVCYEEPGYAYPGCSKKIKEIVLPNTLEELGASAFDGMSYLTTINIPADVTKLQRSTFGNCSQLKHILFAKGKYELDSETFGTYTDETDSEKAMGLTYFKRLSGYQNIYCEKGMILSGNKKNLLLVDSSIKQLVVPKGVKTIHKGAAKSGTYTKVSIPASVTSIKANAFTTNHKVIFSIAKENKHYEVAKGSVYSKVSNRIVVLGVAEDGTVTIPSTVTNLTSNCSKAGKRIKKLVIPKSVTTLKSGWYDSGNYGENGTKIYFTSEKVPRGGKDTVPMYVKMYVPKGSIAQYKKWIMSDKESAKYCKLHSV